MEKGEYQKLYALELSHWWYRGLRELIISQLRSLQPSSRVLDAGCGTGGLLQEIQSFCFAIGMDVKQEAIGLARERGLATLLRGSVDQMPFCSETFDCIISLDVLYHSGVSDDEKALKEFHRIMRTRGHLILNLPAFHFLRSVHDQLIHTQRRYTTRDLKRKLTTAGFKLEKISYRNFFLFPSILIWRMARNLFPGPGPGSDLFETQSTVNQVLLQFLRLENRMLKWTDLPFGSSVFCIARKI